MCIIILTLKIIMDV